MATFLEFSRENNFELPLLPTPSVIELFSAATPRSRQSIGCPRCPPLLSLLLHRCHFQRRSSATASGHPTTRIWPPRSRCITRTAAFHKARRRLCIVFRIAAPSHNLLLVHGGRPGGAPQYHCSSDAQTPMLRRVPRRFTREHTRDADVCQTFSPALARLLGMRLRSVLCVSSHDRGLRAPKGNLRGLRFARPCNPPTGPSTQLQLNSIKPLSGRRTHPSSRGEAAKNGLNI